MHLLTVLFTILITINAINSQIPAICGPNSNPVSNLAINGIFYNPQTQIFNVYHEFTEAQFHLVNNSVNPVQKNSLTTNHKPDAVILFSDHPLTYSVDSRGNAEICLFKNSTSKPSGQPCQYIANDFDGFRSKPLTSSDRVLKVEAATYLNDWTSVEKFLIVAKRRVCTGGQCGEYVYSYVLNQDSKKVSSNRVLNDPSANSMAYLGKREDGLNHILMFFENVYAEYSLTDKELLRSIEPNRILNWRLSRAWLNCPPILCFDAEFDAIDQVGNDVIAIAEHWEFTNFANPQKRPNLVKAIATLINGLRIELYDKRAWYTALDGSVSDKSIGEFFRGHKGPVDSMVRLPSSELLITSLDKFSIYKVRVSDSVLSNKSMPFLIQSRWQGLPDRINGAMISPKSNNYIRFQTGNFFFDVPNGGGVAITSLIQELDTLRCSGFDYNILPKFLGVNNLNDLKSLRFANPPPITTATIKLTTTTTKSKRTTTPTTISPTTQSGPAIKTPVEESSFPITAIFVIVVIVLIVILVAGVLLYNYIQKKAKLPRTAFEKLTASTVQTVDSTNLSQN